MGFGNVCAQANESFSLQESANHMLESLPNWWWCVKTGWKVREFSRFWLQLFNLMLQALSKLLYFRACFRVWFTAAISGEIRTYDSSLLEMRKSHDSFAHAQTFPSPTYPFTINVTNLNKQKNLSFRRSFHVIVLSFYNNSSFLESDLWVLPIICENVN